MKLSNDNEKGFGKTKFFQKKIQFLIICLIAILISGCEFYEEIAEEEPITYIPIEEIIEESPEEIPEEIPVAKNVFCANRCVRTGSINVPIPGESHSFAIVVNVPKCSHVLRLRWAEIVANDVVSTSEIEMLSHFHDA